MDHFITYNATNERRKHWTNQDFLERVEQGKCSEKRQVVLATNHFHWFEWNLPILCSPRTSWDTKIIFMSLS